jgi:hypothetical protein
MVWWRTNLSPGDSVDGFSRLTAPENEKPAPNFNSIVKLHGPSCRLLFRFLRSPVGFRGRVGARASQEGVAGRKSETA